MTLAELILAHTDMGLGPHDEVLMGMIPPNGEGVIPFRIVAIQSGYFIVNDLSLTELAKEKINEHVGK